MAGKAQELKSQIDPIHVLRDRYETMLDGKGKGRCPCHDSHSNGDAVHSSDWDEARGGGK